MRIDLFELGNFCQHRSLRWKFKPGLVGVCGPNGVGKSNAVSVGIYACLTGDYSRHPLGKAGCICQQMEEGESSFMRLCGQQGATVFDLRRGLANPENHRLAIKGIKEVITKAPEIQTKLESVLGLQRRLIDDYVFINQGDMFAVLSALPAKRAQSFARLCATAKAEAAWKALGPWIDKDMPLTVASVGDLAVIEEELATFRKRVRVASRKLKEAKHLLLKLAAKKEQEQIVRDFARREELATRIKELDRDEQKLLFAARTASSAYRDAEEEAHGASVAIGVLREHVQRDADDVAAYEERKKLWERKQELDKERETLTDAEWPELECPCDATVEALVTEQAEGQAAVRELEKRAELLCAGECPTCGKPFDDPDETVEDVEARVKDLKARLAFLVRLIPARRLYENQLAKQRQLQAVASSRLKQVKKELVELVGVSAPPASAAKKAEEVKKLRKEISDKEAAQETRVTRRDGLLRVREQRVAEHRAKKQALSAAHDEYDKIAVTKVDKDSAEKVLQANRDNELAVERHRAKLEEFQRTVEEKERALEQGRAVRDRGARAAVWVTLLSRAREKAHRDNLPAKVHHAALEDLEEKVNESLGEFDSPFRVSATEDLSFTAHFNNGTVVPAAALSGGQKMLLAISFRLVVNSTYADQMGIMILDEPTDGLDQANRALAADVFVRLGDLAKRRGHQIIVVTHDEILHRTFDEILSL